MTSKHLFFKTMWEDLRHKIWMIALSVLGNFLLLPVAWLVIRNNLRMYTPIEPYEDKYLWGNVLSFFGGWVPIAGGVIVIAGALIVGLFGFRYVFRKNMVDTYHSIPVKRSTLYGACWLNGFLIWLVPFLTCFIVAFVMALTFLLGNTNETSMLPALFQMAAITLLILTVVFLLVYHLVLTAVMLSGNVLNTLVSMVILGVAVITLYALGVSFFAAYMDTFYENLNPEPAYYLSPFISAVYLLYRGVMAMDGYPEMSGLWQPILVNTGMMALLGGAAWGLYKKRASELAEQGIRNKMFSAALKIVVSVAAGMGGWGLFHMLTMTNSNTAWRVFGALLAGILVFGVMDIIFSMDFKAFFSHKLQMGLAMALSLLICFSLYGDWYGYDSYLPDKEDIAEIAIEDTGYSNRRVYYSYGNDGAWLDVVSIQDIDTAYDYLEVMAEREKNYDFLEDMNTHNAKMIKTKVTLKNGRTYYRMYRVFDIDRDLVWPLYNDLGYLEANYLVDEELASGFDQISLQRADRYSQTNEVAPEVIMTLAEAYNQDLLENPDSVLPHQGRLLTRVGLERSTGSYSYRGNDGLQIHRLDLEVYDTMENTIEALNRMGYGEWTALKGAEEIAEIELHVYRRQQNYASSEQVITDAREHYGVFADEPVSFDVAEDSAAVISAQTQALSGHNLFTIKITDKAEIEELTALMSYVEAYYTDRVFCKDFVLVNVISNDGEHLSYYIHQGDLPEKYIIRFGQLYEYLTQ